jgi:hypothetical protein
VLKKLREAKTLQFRVDAQIALLDDATSKMVWQKAPLHTITISRPSSILILSTQRPNVSAPKADGSFTVNFEGTLFDREVSDGKKWMESSSKLRRGQIGEAQFDLGDNAYYGCSQDAFFNVLLGSFANKFVKGKVVKVDGRSLQVYLAEETFKNDLTKYVLYADPKSGMPVRITSAGYIKGMKLVEQRQADFTDWKIDEKVAPEVFSTVPPEGYTMTQRQTFIRQP